MPVPDFQSFMLPLLTLTADGEEPSLAEAVERLAQEFQLTDEDRAQLLRSGQTRLYNRVWKCFPGGQRRPCQAAPARRLSVPDKGPRSLFEGEFAKMKDSTKAKIGELYAEAFEALDAAPPRTNG